MEWTVEQVNEMRRGRPTYGDREKSGALTWLRTAEETGGAYGLIFAEFGPDYKVFPHYHTLYTETFKVLEGGVEGLAGDQSVTLGIGDEIAAPPRMVHGWSGSTEGLSSVIVELRPAHEGFEKWIVMIHNMAADGLTSPEGQPKNFLHAALLLRQSDINLPGRARMLNPVLKVLAWLAQKAGVERRLEEKYYRPSTGDVAAT